MGFNTFPCNPYPISTEELNKGNNDDLNTRVATLEEAVTTLKSGLTNIGNATDLGKVQGSGTVTLSDSVTNYRFVQVLIGYYNTGYPCYGQALLLVSTLPISPDDIPITVPFSNRTGTTTGNADISFLSATSVKVVNTSETKYTRVVGIA